MTKAKTTIELNLDVLNKSDLSIAEYTFLLLASRKDSTYINIIFDSSILQNLIDKGYLTDMSTTLDSIELTDKFSVLTNGITLSEEEGLALLKARYPKSELRKNQRVPLQKNAKGIQISYHKTIGSSQERLNRALKALNYMLEQREMAGDRAQFLPDLQVWLNQEQWKSYEEVSSDERKFEGSKTSINL